MPLHGTGNQNNFERSASVVIKFKSENCLNVLKIVNKEPDTISLFIYKKSLDWHNCYFYYGRFFVYDLLYMSFFWFKFDYN